MRAMLASGLLGLAGVAAMLATPADASAHERTRLGVRVDFGGGYFEYGRGYYYEPVRHYCAPRYPVVVEPVYVRPARTVIVSPAPRCHYDMYYYTPSYYYRTYDLYYYRR